MWNLTCFGRLQIAVLETVSKSKFYQTNFTWYISNEKYISFTSSRMQCQVRVMSCKTVISVVLCLQVGKFTLHVLSCYLPNGDITQDRLQMTFLNLNKTTRILIGSAACWFLPIFIAKFSPYFSPICPIWAKFGLIPQSYYVIEIVGQKCS